MTRALADKTISAPPGRDRALMAIAEVFRRYGFEAASMTILGRETGLGRSSLYHYFPGGKQEMALAMLDLAEGFLRDDLLARLDGEAPAEMRRENFLARLCDYYRGGALGCVFASLSLHDCPPEVAARVAALMRFWIAALAEKLAGLGLDAPQARAAGAIRDLQGGLVVALSSGDPRHFETALADVRRRLGPD